MRKILEKLLKLNINAFIVTPRWIAHKNGTTFAYSNSSPSGKANVFGDSAVKASVSVYDLNNPQAEKVGSNIRDGKVVTIWLNGLLQDEADLYIDTYGKECIAILKEDGNADLLTADQANALLDSPPADVSVEEPASVE